MLIPKICGKLCASASPSQPTSSPAATDQKMTKRFPPQPDDNEVTGLPRTVAEAVQWLILELNQTEKGEVAGTPEEDLIGLCFGLGSRIRNELGLQGDNPALFSSCGKANADDASLVIIRALWARLRH